MAKNEKTESKEQKVEKTTKKVKNSEKQQQPGQPFFEKNQLFDLNTPIDRKHGLPVDCRAQN